jgi:uncharacterized RDD family membrane protein YckC
MPDKPTRVVGQRVGALLLDLIPQYGFAAILFALMAEHRPGIGTGSGQPTHLTINDHSIVGGGKVTLFLVLWLAFSFVYNACLEGTKGWTPGKLVLGIRVVDAGGQVPGVGKAAVRWVFWFVDAIFFWVVAFVTALATRDNQRVGDLVAKTYVVRKDAAGQPVAFAAGPPPPPPL